MTKSLLDIAEEQIKQLDKELEEDIITQEDYDERIKEIQDIIKEDK